MAEEIKERLSKKEYEKVGEMLLELIAECPHIPKELLEKSRILYDYTDDEEGIFILTDGGKVKKKNVLGGFTAVLGMQIAYQSFPTTNMQRINAQHTVNQIAEWLGDIENLPKLTGNRVITKFDSSGSFPSKDDAGEDKSVVFAANAEMEYEVD